jgi:hypothetical protein
MDQVLPAVPNVNPELIEANEQLTKENIKLKDKLDEIHLLFNIYRTDFKRICKS